jgi:hypothetical protein
LLSWRLVLRRSLIAAVLAVLLLPAAAAAQSETVELMPGVTYTREVRWEHGGPLVIHSIVGPRPGGLYALRPVLSNDLVLGRETVSAMQQRLAPQATAAGVNGDLFTWETGHPSGILLQDGVLTSRPVGGRSSLGIGTDGTLFVGRIDFFGSWRVSDGENSPLSQFNRPLLQNQPNEAGLFTPSWGGPTPKVADAIDIVLSGFPAAAPNADLTGVVVELRIGGGTPIPEGGAVVQARGLWADKLALQAAPGLPLTLHLILKPWWDGVTHAIGGGPVIVRDGQPVFRANEDFTPSQTKPRHPRTAVGQLADGRIVLVAVDGRSSFSQGMNLWELALELIRLGAVTAMAFDAGGSTTIAFDGRVLNTPSDGSERPVGDALMLLYYGAFAPPLRYRIVSPNDDGFAEAQEGLIYKVVRPSTVDAKLVAPDGSVVWGEAAAKEPGVYAPALDPATAFSQQGPYQWIVSAVDDLGQASGMTRTFTVNNTLGFLEFSKRIVRPKPRLGGKLEISFELAAPAWVIVTIEDATGKLVRKLHARRHEPKRLSFTWDAKNAKEKVVRTGKYTIQVRGANELGVALLERKIAVRVKSPRP